MKPSKTRPTGVRSDVPLCQLVGRLRFRQLALLAALDEHRNLHRAAAAVHLAQPSATKIVRDLERLFDFPLFERLPRGMYPTALGADVLSFARRALAELQRFAKELEHKRLGGNGRLTIGALPGAATRHVAAAMAEIKLRRPLLSIELFGERCDELVALLLDQSIDFGVGYFNDRSLNLHIAYEPLGSEVLDVIARPDHPATRISGLQLRSLKSYPMMVPTLPSTVRVNLEQEFAQADLETPANMVESASWLTTLQIAQQTDAIAVVPESIVRDHVRAGLLARLPLVLSTPLPTFGILTRRDHLLPTAATEFIDLLRRHAARHDPQQNVQTQADTTKSRRFAPPRRADSPVDLQQNSLAGA